MLHLHWRQGTSGYVYGCNVAVDIYYVMELLFMSLRMSVLSLVLYTIMVYQGNYIVLIGNKSACSSMKKLEWGNIS